VNTHVNISPSLAPTPNNSSLNTNNMDNARSSKHQFSMRTDWAPEPEYERDPRSQLKGEAGGPDSAQADREDFPPVDMLPIPKAFEAKLIKNERVTPASHWQDIRLLTFHVSEDRPYYPGDTVTIFPKNFHQDVQSLIDLQDWNEVADLPLAFEAQAPDYFGAENLVSKPHSLVPLEDSTLRELLLHNLDITAIPNRHFFHLIAHFTDDLTHRERLLEFTNPMYTDEFFDYTTRPRRSILEVLHDFPSVRLPWKWATTIFPPIRGRQFSICSGGIQQDCPGFRGRIRLQILVAIVRYKTVLKKIRQGLCSRYIAGLSAGSTIAMTMTPNLAFYKAVEASVGLPIIMVGPGTGVAPCRSLIWHRAAEAIEYPNQNRDMVLFFGSRNKKADYFFEDEWRNPTLRTEVFTAFSRDQREKIYVQDLIRREGKLVHQLLAANALIIVCGSSGRMPLQVRQAFVDIMEEHGGPWENKEQVERTFEFLEKRGQYLQETW
jgi:sulfite reductase alpha subunit-like flavoprotein